MSESILTNIEDTNPEKYDDDDEDNNLIHDFPSMLISLCKSIPIKTSIYLFILMLIIFSQQFIEYVLLPMGGEDWVDADQPTNVGTIILCLITTLGYILIYLLIKSLLI